MKYLLSARHRKGHGIHSPYVFDLVTRVFRNKISPDIVLIIENIRKERLSDKRTISVRDLGAGSVKTKSSLRKVSDITRYSAVPFRYCALLANLSAEFGDDYIVELGTSLGFSAMYLAKGAPQTVVYTIEGCPALTEIAAENFRRAGIENIRPVNGSFDEMVPELKKKGIKPGLVFIDGNHRKEAVLRYFGHFVEMTGGKGVVIIDDIHISNEMEEAWEEIKNYKNVSFTVDIFRMGLVFFREGINHFDYVLRY
ncbi:MAG: class I SAM-dependent methyltransferase [Bacteroidales bacterium]|nr:class I SAM-dependent methyltransferase [Bacteroidales bacterium]